MGTGLGGLALYADILAFVLFESVINFLLKSSKNGYSTALGGFTRYPNIIKTGPKAANARGWEKDTASFYCLRPKKEDFHA